MADARRLNAYGAIESLLGTPITPLLTGEVGIIGEPVSGQTLTLKTDLGSIPPVPELGELSYQWLRDTTMIEGAVFDTYTLTQEDIDHMIRVQVSAANCYGTVTSPAFGPVRASTVAVRENREDLFYVYPNPTQGRFTVEGKGTFTITNVLGQTMMTMEINGQTSIELPKGVWFVRLGGTTQKVVVE